MKEEILAHLGDIAGLAKQGIIQASVILQEQVPGLCEEVIRWGLVVNLFGILIGIVLGVLTLIFGAYLYKCEKEELKESDKGMWAGMRLFAYVIGLGASSGFLFTSLYYLTKVLATPKLYLIEYLRSLL